MKCGAQVTLEAVKWRDMFTLDEVVPWGRSFDEYRLMFALSDMDLELRILGCADGPVSLNAVATRRRAPLWFTGVRPGRQVR